ncbi:MAG: GspE/PulE family protein [Candidatus Paceibacterota bacterium]
MANKDLDSFLKKQRRAAEERDAKRRADKLDLSYLDLLSTGTPTEIKALEIVPEEEAREAKMTPVQVVAKNLVVTAYDPENEKTKDLIEKLKKEYKVTIAVSSMSGLKHAWEHYKFVHDEGEQITGKVNINPERIEKLSDKINTIDNLSKLIDSFESPQTSQILEIILAGAMALGASDIHIEPNKESSDIRLRIDGILHIITKELDLKIYHSAVTRIKLLSGLKLNVKDEAQDGRFTISISEKDIEIRTSIIPSEYGETGVLRILDPDALKISLEDLGWRKDDLNIVNKQIAKPNGLILNTGPTGSGKTTTLYAFLKRLAKPEIKIITVEDPIEYHLEGISQTQVDKSSGYTFASGLRSILRQDPDAILVGEIRDEETSKIALNASLTGHMVFSTLHTNDSVGAIPRLIDLGSKPNIIGPSLSLIIAQRLVRRLCENCKKEKEVSKELEAKLKKILSELPERVNKDDYKKFTLFDPVGCKDCNNLGYKGRTSIFELFEITEKIENLIYQNPTETDLKKAAEENGMTTIQEDGLLKIIKGITSIEEVERVAGELNL